MGWLKIQILNFLYVFRMFKDKTIQSLINWIYSDVKKVDRVYEDDKLEIEISDGVKVNVIKNTVQSHLKKEIKK